MKREDKSEELLYRSMMEELMPGAEEYDRLLASGEAPARRKGSARKATRMRLTELCGIAAMAVGVVFMIRHFDVNDTSPTLSTAHQTENVAPDVASQDAEKREKEMLMLIVEDVARRMAEQELNSKTYIL